MMRSPVDLQPIVSVDLIEITDTTSIPFAAKATETLEKIKKEQEEKKLVSKQAKLPYSITNLNKDPVYNIKLGSYYLNSLLENYNGVYPFAIAAYNAGPKRVKTWRRVNGDPTKNQISYIDWVELIRFKETRNYVQRVMENMNVYNYMLNQSPVSIKGFLR